jgi:hypothetical protein
VRFDSIAEDGRKTDANANDARRETGIDCGGRLRWGELVSGLKIIAVTSFEVKASA